MDAPGDRPPRSRPAADGSPRLAGADPIADARRWEVTLVAVLFGAAIVVFGVIPSPLLDLADHAGQALGLL